MKHFLPLVLSVFFLFTSTAQGQNLVPNGGFEEGVNCPTTVGNVTEECLHWYGSLIDNFGDTPTPDWFHQCSEVDLLTPPEIAFGSQEPLDGGYVGVVAFVRDITDYRELVGVELAQPLEIGQSYLIEFQISATSTPGNAVWANQIGFNFSTHPFYSVNSFPINGSHFSVDTIVPESDNWLQVSEQFVADSAYNYFHIGNFHDDQNTDTLLSGISSYFLIDQVVISQSLDLENSKTPGYVIYPNPTSDVVNIHASSLLNFTRFTISDPLGRRVMSGNLRNVQESFRIEVGQLDFGHYILRLETPKDYKNEVFIKL